jgi:hypothetical protein
MKDNTVVFNDGKDEDAYYDPTDYFISGFRDDPRRACHFLICVMIKLMHESNRSAIKVTNEDLDLFSTRNIACAGNGKDFSIIMLLDDKDFDENDWVNMHLIKEKLKDELTNSDVDALFDHYGSPFARRRKTPQEIEEQRQKELSQSGSDDGNEQRGQGAD